MKSVGQCLTSEGAMPAGFSASMPALVVAYDMVTPHGWGVEALWQGLISSKTAIRPLTRFDATAFRSQFAGLVEGLDTACEDSLVLQMLRPLIESARPMIPADARVILATTIGEVDRLEKALLKGEGRIQDSQLGLLLETTRNLAGSKIPGLICSCACASSAAALARAASLIREGANDAVLVIACDSVTEFVFSGFSSLMALDPQPARPFDRNKQGLTLGEAAAYALVMSEERARREGREPLGEIAGWGLSSDANHMTGPCRDGQGLVLAIQAAMAKADIHAEKIDSISAHGTGTRYNDAMEMKAFQRVFGPRCVPTYSIKGAIGHTLGAAGVLEAILCLKSFAEGEIPGTVGLNEPDEEALGWVSPESLRIEGAEFALSTNSGFGGVNTALILKARRDGTCNQGCTD